MEPDIRGYRREAMADNLFGVTGATGELGGRVAARLAERGVTQRLVVRDPSRAPELPGAEVARASSYGDGEEMRRALEGVRTLFLVSAGEARDRLQQHFTAVDAAVAAGVERIVYLSFLSAAPDATFTFARDHFHTEEHVRSTGTRHAFLRPSMYLDYIPFFCSPDGVIQGPAGDGRLAPISRDDLADVAAVVLTEDGRHDGQTFEVTGPEPITLHDAAEQLSLVTGRTISYLEESVEEARASRAPSGAPDWEIEGWVTSYAAIAAGELDVVSDTVARLTGHRPQTLPEFLRQHPESFRHLLTG